MFDGGAAVLFAQSVVGNIMTDPNRALSETRTLRSFFDPFSGGCFSDSFAASTAPPLTFDLGTLGVEPPFSLTK